MILLLHARHALRRAWTAPLRSLCVLAASAAVWTALFGLAADAAEAQNAARRAGLMNGSPAWRITLEKTHRNGVQARPLVLPFELVEQLRAHASALVVRTSAPIRVGERGRALSAELLFYQLGPDTATAPAPAASFPPCSLIAAPPLAGPAARLVSVGRDWRCRLAPLPPALAVLGAARTSPALLIPIGSMAAIAGPRARERIDTLWVGIDDEKLFMRLLAAVRARYALELTVYAFGQRMKASVDEAASHMRLARLASGVGLGLSLGLYVHGVFGAMRRELALRTCLGHSFVRVLAWLQVDVWTQSLAMSLLSCAVGLGLHAARAGHGIDREALLLAGAINGAIALALALVCAAAALLVFRHSRAVQLAGM